MTYDIVTIGESMLRLSPPNHERIRRMRTLDVHMCGSQQNVAANTARLGLKTAFLSKLPQNALGLYARDFCMSCGVDVSHIKMIDDSRLGVNFLEFGATPRASRVVYDRKNSAASTICPGEFDFETILEDTALAYTDGIFPGLSGSCSDTAIEFVRTAKRAGCQVAFDVNYREHLWSPPMARQVQREIIKNVDVLITTQWDSEIVFGYQGSYEDIIRQFYDEFGCPVIAITLRENYDVQRGAWQTLLLYKGDLIYGEKFEMDLIDRFGGGDSWASGFLYAYLISEGDVQYAADFGDAFCALHHTIPGDVCHVTASEVRAIMGANKDFRVKR